MGNISVCLYIDGNDPIDSRRLQERTGRVPGMLSLGRCMSLMHKWMDRLIWKDIIYGKRWKDRVRGSRRHGNSLLIASFLSLKLERSSVVGRVREEVRYSFG